jgi:hypothetical protein
MGASGIARLLEGQVLKGGHALRWDDSVPAPMLYDDGGNARYAEFGDVFRG